MISSDQLIKSVSASLVLALVGSMSTNAAPEAKDQVKSGLLLNVVVGHRAAIFELFAGKDQPLLIRRDALLVLDLRLHVVNCVRTLHLQSDRFAGQCLHENLHAITARHRRQQQPREANPEKNQPKVLHVEEGRETPRKLEILKI
ncbi:hypothetical protein GPALN_016269 [Globodera pallida]|nr:hypothetical protein GPALN_016269 [Globodera pallida]